MFIVISYLLFHSCAGTLTEEEQMRRVNSLSDQIREMMEHYKQADPVGLPGAPIQDPMAIPDMRHSKHLTTLLLSNATVHGLSKFKIDQIYFNLAEMQAEAAFRYSKVEVHGSYVLSSLFSRSSGGFNVTLVGVYLEGVGLLEVSRYGNLEAAHINMDISVTDIALDFQNLTFFGSIFQGMINTIGPFVFDNIKPFILSEVDTNVLGDINKNLKTLKQTFPNSIPPIDLAIAEARKWVRSKYDPYKFKDYQYSAGIFSMDLRDIWVTGLASFHRIGNLTVAVTNNTLQAHLHTSTKRLRGVCQWEVSVGGFNVKYGSTSFTVDYLQVDTKINQSLNVRNTPKLEELQIILGNIQLRMEGLGTLDYILEFVVNILPNVLRYQIVDAVEGLLRQRIQAYLNLIDVEKQIESRLQEFDTMTSRNSTDLDPPEYDLSDDDLFEDIALR